MAPERIIKREGYTANLRWCQPWFGHLLTGLAKLLFLEAANRGVMLIYFNYQRLTLGFCAAICCLKRRVVTLKIHSYRISQLIFK